MARSIDTMSCTPLMSIVTVDGVEETTRKEPTDFDNNFGGSFD